jgi:hypothetical protein
MATIVRGMRPSSAMKMVRPDRIERPTFAMSRRRSTTELRTRYIAGMICKRLPHARLQTALRVVHSMSRRNEPWPATRRWLSPYRRYRNIPETKMPGPRHYCALVRPHIR